MLVVSVDPKVANVNTHFILLTPEITLFFSHLTAGCPREGQYTRVSFSLLHARSPGACDDRLGDEGRRLMHIVPAAAVRLMKSRV